MSPMGQETKCTEARVGDLKTCEGGSGGKSNIGFPRKRGRSSLALAGRSHVDLAALEQIIESAHAIPAICECVEQEMMAAVLARAAVVLGQQINQQSGRFIVQPDVEADLAR